MTEIGLIGVPIETVPIRDAAIIMSAYIPSITDSIREKIIDSSKEKSLKVHDLGELFLGEFYDPGFKIDRKEGIPAEFYPEKIQTRDFNLLERGREYLFDLEDKLDLIIAIGPSHLGAMALYQEGDEVARLDYHSDFLDFDYKNIHFSYASYMNWVEKNVKPVRITNYFVKERFDAGVLGFDSKSIADERYLTSNHFDIDVDCFNSNYRIQDVYPHPEGESKEATPENVLNMISKAVPNKIGFWEYREKYDYNNIGLELIVDSISAVSRLIEQKSLKITN